LKTAFTILHLSDLHRNEDGMVSNDQLISSLQLDADRYTSAQYENLPKPSIIIISGDLIYGSGNSDIKAAEDEVREQYREANQFVNQLTEEFLEGDKTRIVIVPGNHDMQWAISKVSMEKIDLGHVTSEDLSKIKADVKNPKSNIRWNWSDLSFYRIINDNLYNARVKLFAEFYEKFYDGERTYSLNPDKQYDIFDIPSHNLAIAAYNSCFRNDHLNRSGLINAHCLSDSVRDLRTLKAKRRLLFATWHHNFSGLPNDDTYLDPRQIKSLSSYGYTVGFHGHQHLSDIVESYVQFDNSRKLISVSAGTLCSARSHLPTGFKRQYNLVNISYVKKECFVYSREMHGNMDDIPLWDRGRINESLNSSANLEIVFPESVPVFQATEKQIDSLTMLLKSNKHDDFLYEIKSMPIDDPLIRSIIIEFDSQSGGKYKSEICNILAEPDWNNFEECILFIDNHLEKTEKGEAEKILTKAIKQFDGQKTLVDQLSKYKVRIHGYK
jgi:hypothetical protein